MNRHWELIPEGKADRVLLEVLGFKNPGSGNGIGDVINQMKDNFKGRFAIGLVDDDRRKPTMFDEFKLLKKQSNLQLRQRKAPESRHFLIVINPALEDWLFERARNVDIDPARFGFENRKMFQRICKDQAVHSNQKFLQFLHQIWQTREDGMMILSQWLRRLYDQHGN